MESFVVFKAISFLLSAFVLIFSLKYLPRGKARFLFAAMIFSFFLSTVFYFGEGVLNEWLKHIPFYAGQLFFYFFASCLIVQPVPSSEKNLSFFVPLLAVFAASDARDFIAFLTAQGIQHIVVFPATVIIIIALQAQQITSPFLMARKSSLTIFFSGLGILTLIHTVEFFIESQLAFPSFGENAMEITEFMLFYAGITLFYIGARRLFPGTRAAENI